ncbi:hypothetical protein LIER_33742 [Lithospermum erythrorhizon]|uniref:non-specific serine/threonine protein kinase n=1 Tax=Lithospermum erythrorhizon TaxID=34254 RepID=A0AAV3S1A6_LITER
MTSIEFAPHPSPPLRHHDRPLTPPLAAFSILILLTLCFRKLHRKRPVPSSTDSNPKQPRRFSYSDLRRATSSFASLNRLGQGGFGSVYRGNLQINKDGGGGVGGTDVAVKVMDSGSLQGEREFHNELLFASKMDSNYIVSVLGFCSDRKRRRMMIVYELMEKGSLQDCLFHRKSKELRDWNKRFGIGLDIAKGLEYLHHSCDPPIIHGDIKPSNILLDGDFNAKISDFGLGRLKSDVQIEIDVKEVGTVDYMVEDNNRSIFDGESVFSINRFEEGHGALERSPESVLRIDASPETLNGVELSPEAPVVSPRAVLDRVSPSEGLDKSSVSEANFDGFSVESGRETVDGGRKKRRKKKSFVSGKDWWWKQDNGGGESGPVKDYVMEWLGNEIKKERPKSDLAGTSSNTGVIPKIEKKKKLRKRLEWWVSMDDEKKVKEKRRPAREWWKEEYSEELARENKKKKKRLQGYMSDDHYSDNWLPKDALHSDKRKRRSRSRGSIGSTDWWLEGFSGELWRTRISHDSISGEVPKSVGITSTPSMRGTVCYIAPEYGGGGDFSEKCDVYSYGVLLLVLIAGRRPLQVTGSPMSEFQRANLLSWARHLARRGKLLELVDGSIQSFDNEQALLCITVALHCLRKSPTSRPSMKEVVKYLSGELEPPELPLEFSPSPAAHISLKSRRKAR